MLIKQANEVVITLKGTNVRVSPDTLIVNIDVSLCMVEENSRTILTLVFKNLEASLHEWCQFWSPDAVYHFRMWCFINI